MHQKQTTETKENQQFQNQQDQWQQEQRKSQMGGMDVRQGTEQQQRTGEQLTEQQRKQRQVGQQLGQGTARTTGTTKNEYNWAQVPSWQQADAYSNAIQKMGPIFDPTITSRAAHQREEVKRGAGANVFAQYTTPEMRRAMSDAMLQKIAQGEGEEYQGLAVKNAEREIQKAGMMGDLARMMAPQRELAGTSQDQAQENTQQNYSQDVSEDVSQGRTTTNDLINSISDSLGLNFGYSDQEGSGTGGGTSSGSSSGTSTQTQKQPLLGSILQGGMSAAMKGA